MTTEIDGVLYELIEHGIGIFTGATPQKDCEVSFATVIPIEKEPQSK